MGTVGCNGNQRKSKWSYIQDDPEDCFSLSYLRKQVSILWIPAFAGVTTAGVVKYVVPKSNDESPREVPSEGEPPSSLRGSYRRSSSLSTRSSEFFARLPCRTIRAKLSRQRYHKRGADVFAEPTLEQQILSRPRRERAVRESVRQQGDQGVHDFGREFGAELGAPVKVIPLMSANLRSSAVVTAVLNSLRNFSLASTLPRWSPSLRCLEIFP